MGYKIKEFWEFCKIGDLINIESCVQEKLNIHSTDERGLSYAMQNNHFEVVKYLIEIAEADYNVKEGYLLKSVVKSKSKKMFDYFFTEKNICKNSYMNALFGAAEVGNNYAFFEIIKYKKNVVEQLAQHENTKLLFSACMGGDKEILKFINEKIIKIIKIMETEDLRKHCFISVCESGNLEGVKYVFQIMNSNIPEDYIRSVICAAIRSKSIELMKWLDRNQLLIFDKMQSYYIEYDNPVIEYCVEKGYRVEQTIYKMLYSDLSAEEIDGFIKRIHFDVNNGKLLDLIFDKFVEWDNKKTCIKEALVKLEYIGFRFSDCNIKYFRGLFRIKSFGLDILEYLICTGVNINAVDENGDTLLEFAVHGYDNRVIEFLLCNGADPNIGWSLINTAVEDGMITISLPEDYSFKEHGLSIPEQDYSKLINKVVMYDDESPVLLSAINMENEDAIKMLVCHGAKYKKVGGFVIPRARYFKLDSIVDYLMIHE